MYRLNEVKAFSLLELLVSIAIMTVIISVLCDTSIHNINVMNHFQSRFDAFHASNAVLDQINRDLKNIVLLDQQDKFSFSGQAGTISFTALVHGQGTESGTNLAYIRYFLKDHTLVRELASLSRTQSAFSASGTDAQEIGTSIQSLSFLYTDSGFEKESTSWTEKNRLPGSVKIDLRMMSGDTKQEGFYSETVILPWRNRL